ncbi:MAG: hypothetical protein A2W91_09125 [Bacteroidetes bacterium GWF2_38_335]|nr:MAG: hypothetical protein A2W91_09125 [Bacteroidetes bacterium GWF2_38_335]OFY80533.1 MAG: hypothetical protein A2281_08850 [Bacteroidetes bacterium RIFOXYA12_FULL_38_20]HBS85856.1 hypothetical protein [Bacteroidales bacterium]
MKQFFIFTLFLFCFSGLQSQVSADSIINNNPSALAIPDLLCDCINQSALKNPTEKIQPYIEKCLSSTFDTLIAQKKLEEFMADTKKFKDLLTYSKLKLFTGCEPLVKYQRRYFFLKDSLALDKMGNPDTKRMFIKGMGLIKSGDYKSAQVLFLDLVKKDSTFAFAYDNIALCYKHKNLKDSAMYYLDRSLHFLPENVNAHLTKAEIYLAKRLIKEAFFEYLKVIEINSSNPEGYFGLGKVFLLNKEYENALMNMAYARQMYKILGNEFYKDAVFMTGYIYVQKGDEINAKKYLKESKDLGFKVPKELVDRYGLVPTGEQKQ